MLQLNCLLPGCHLSLRATVPSAQDLHREIWHSSETLTYRGERHALVWMCWCLKKKKDRQKIANGTLRLTEVGVFHGLLGSQSLLMVITQQLIQQIQSFRAHQVLILWLNKVLPALSRLPGGFFTWKMSAISLTRCTAHPEMVLLFNL